nr:WD40 repeat domain-containing protein [Micromonospora sp. DSM 115978]
MLPVEAFRMAPTVESLSALLSAQKNHYASVLSRPGTGAVHAMAFDPDGQVLAGATHSGALVLWDAVTHAFITELRHGSPVYSVAFSPDGEIIATAGQDGVVRWCDRQSQIMVSEPPGSGEAINNIMFSGDGALLAAASDSGVVELWDVRTRIRIANLRVGVDPVNAVAFSPDGGVVAVASADMTVQLWDVGRRARTDVLRGHTRPVRSVEFSPDGRFLASGGDDRAAHLWDVGSRRRIASFTHHLGPVQSLTFRGDGRVLVTADEATARVWDNQTYSLLASLTGPAGSVLGIDLSPNGGTLASGGGDGFVGFWNVPGPVAPDAPTVVNAVRFGPAGTGLLATASADRGVSIWSLEPLSLVATFDDAQADPPHVNIND